MSFSPEHERFMKRALQLARRGVGLVSPNPAVGAVVVRDGRVVGEGYHLYEQRRHAEVVALERAGAEARGAALYVTLEPCVHHGRTPPCTDAVVRSGIRRVFVAVSDPNPLVSGRGLSTLRAAGIEVVEGVCAEPASLLNESFFHSMRTGRPFVLLKLALSLDGRIATQCGDSKWITGDRARLHAHRLRFESDAVLVGVRTLLQDNSALTIRWRRSKPITRVVLDSELRTPPNARLFDYPDKVIIFHDSQLPGQTIPNYPANTEVVGVRRQENGLDWEAILRILADRRVTQLLIEGGGRVAGSALRAGIVNKLAIFYGGKIVGGDGLPGIAELGVARIGEAPRYRISRIKKMGGDLFVEAYPQVD